LQRRSQERIAYVESVPARGTALIPTQARMYAVAGDLQFVIIASIPAQTARPAA
jgi:hypothetical protein